MNVIWFIVWNAFSDMNTNVFICLAFTVDLVLHFTQYLVKWDHLKNLEVGIAKLAAKMFLVIKMWQCLSKTTFQDGEGTKQGNISLNI